MGTSDDVRNLQRNGVPSSPTPSTTVVMVPRETFASTSASVASVCRSLDDQARLVVVDGGSPRRVRQQLERLARDHDFALLRSDRYLTPNEARNAAMHHVTTPFVAFLDNNVSVSPGWLDALERCAAETGAAVVAPMLVTAELGRSRIHQMGGRAHVADVDGERVLASSHLHQGESLDRHTGATRSVTEQAEFHCMLVDTSWFREVGGLDEELLSLFEHTDLCMCIRAAGGSVWFEPDSVVTYGRPRFIGARDRAFYVLRWSDEWNACSGHRFRSKWRLDADPVQNAANWARNRRRYAYRPFTTPFNRLGPLGRPVTDLVDRVAQERVVAAWRRAGPARIEPRLTHIASWQQ